MMVVLMVIIIVEDSVTVLVVVMVVDGRRVEPIFDAALIDGVHHYVQQLVLVDVQYCAHEVETGIIHRGQGAVVFDAVVHIYQVQGDAPAVLVEDGGLNMTKQATRFALDKLADLYEHVGEAGLSVRIEVFEGTGQTDRNAAGLFHRSVLVVFMVVTVAFVIVMMVLFFAHCIIS